MLNKIPSLFHVLSIGTIINSLHGHPYYNSLHGNSNNGWTMQKLLSSTIDFLKQNRQYVEQELPDMTPQFGDRYDFIVIGAGTAGATIAARLSEVPQIKVLLIEAGSRENLFMDIPVFAIVLQTNNKINSNYRTKSSNKYCRGMKNNSCHWSSGKVVGGSSVLNFMIASRGGAEDYDRWAEMGNEGWAYQDVLQYFKKLETMDIPELKSDIDYHGTNGPVHIAYPSFHTPLAKAFLKAGKELGYPLVDYNGKNEIGFSYLQSTIMNGTRMSSNRAYLHPVHGRTNLHLTRESTVTKVLIDRITNRAIGVEFVKHNQRIRVFANKEVILCAGAIGSPQLLMLSGIGPAKHLSELGINVIQDAPVGDNLMDHPVFFGLTFTTNAAFGLQFFDLINPINPHILDFIINRTGLFTIPGGCEALGFVNTKHPEKNNNLPDIELLFSGGAMKDIIFPRILELNDPITRKWDKYSGSNGWSVLPILLKPKSRGRITLLANDVNVKPEIVPNYFDDPDDVRTMIAGIRTALSIGRTKAMQALNSQFLNITYTECNNYEYDSDAYWECAIRILATTLYHYCGSCKMGPRGDPTAVVDPKLKVIGIEGLRVADASIMPEIISAHLNIPVYMIAEKTADMIKKDWGYLEQS
ncbi:glucose dehydrogenase [FAD, quinone]-like [Temnothorax longispinosus]|uniref:glucose dehydrogenase [FAD, quinone]-like n=1 Tax=Temnothorax longispinosus TaxID=300112 RepID=UPI003A9966A8